MLVLVGEVGALESSPLSSSPLPVAIEDAAEAEGLKKLRLVVVVVVTIVGSSKESEVVLVVAAVLWAMAVIMFFLCEGQSLWRLVENIKSRWEYE